MDFLQSMTPPPPLPVTCFTIHESTRYTYPFVEIFQVLVTQRVEFSREVRHELLVLDVESRLVRLHLAAEAVLLLRIA